MKRFGMYYSLELESTYHGEFEEWYHKGDTGYCDPEDMILAYATVKEVAYDV